MALTILVITAIVSGLTQSSVFSKRVDMVYTATLIAQNRIDLLKKISFSELPDATEVEVVIDEDGTLSAGGSYIRTTEVTENYDGIASLLKIKVSVTALKISASGAAIDEETGYEQYMKNPIVMETIFVDTK